MGYPQAQSVDSNGIVSGPSGNAYTAVAAATTSAGIKTGAGRLAKVIVTATGTGTATVYDNTSASGTVILAIPASAAVGTIYDVQVPFVTGLSVVSATSGPALIVTWS